MEHDKNCNSGLQKQFAEAYISAVKNLAKEYSLDELVVEWHNPLVVAVRGCLRKDAKDAGEPIQLVSYLSDDLSKVEQNIQMNAINTLQTVAAPAEISKSYDLTELVTHQTVAQAGQAPKEQTDDPCK